MVSNKLLPKFPITINDITNAKYIFGPYLAGIRGKTVKPRKIRVDTDEYVTTPSDFYKLHKFVILTVDVMFVNINAFMIISARKLNFVTIYYIQSQK